MGSARALGIVMNDPPRGHVALHALRQLLPPPATVDAVGYGTCVDGNVLLTRLPAFGGDRELSSLVGPMRGRVSLVHLRDGSELSPPRDPARNLGPYRFRGFACVVLGGAHRADDATASREAFTAELPDFLSRSLQGQSEGEAFFFAVLARLYRQGWLERPQLDARALGEAIAETQGLRSPSPPRHVVFATGAEVVHASFQVPGALLTLEGLTPADADALDPTLADTSPGRERLRRFRACVSLGSLGSSDSAGGLPATLPPGISRAPFPASGMVLLSRHGRIETLDCG